MCRLLGLKPSGGNYRILYNAIEMYKIDTSHFTGQRWNVNLKFKPFDCLCCWSLPCKVLSFIQKTNKSFGSEDLRGKNLQYFTSETAKSH